MHILPIIHNAGLILAVHAAHSVGAAVVLGTGTPQATDAGVQEVSIAAGVEQMSRVSFASDVQVQEQLGHAVTAQMQNRYHLTPDYSLTGQVTAAELMASRWRLARTELDELAVRSHALAQQTTAAGGFAREIVPISVEGVEIATDQGIRPGTDLETLAALRPAFAPDGVVTAATSSQISDGAAAVLLMSGAKADELGLRPRARIVDHLTVGVDPQLMLSGPIPATQRILKRNGLRIADLDAIEINEAFASVVAAWMRELKPDLAAVNPRGGAMALGHPLGASGARLATTLLHYLEDQDLELGLVTMCCGGWPRHGHCDPAGLIAMAKYLHAT